MPLQMRLYRINKGELEAFAQEWEANIKPLRVELGFTVPAAYTVPTQNLFVWFLQHDSAERWDELDKAYHDSDARKAMEPDPARLIARVEQYFVEAV